MKNKRDPNNTLHLNRMLNTLLRGKSKEYSYSEPSFSFENYFESSECKIDHIHDQGLQLCPQLDHEEMGVCAHMFQPKSCLRNETKAENTSSALTPTLKGKLRNMRVHQSEPVSNCTDHVCSFHYCHSDLWSAS